MSAVRQPQSNPWRAVIVKLYNTTYTLDPYSDRLNSLGYDLVNTTSYANTLKAARELRAALIIVHDDPNSGIDAIKWIEMQHMDPSPALPMMPTIVVCDLGRLATLRIEEIPDRVIVLQNRADTLNQLARTVKRILHVWELDQSEASEPLQKNSPGVAPSARV
jgi:hypothetical protein